MLLDWMPCTSAATMRAASSGSSPWYSKFLPHQGTRARFTPGPSITLVPFSHCSRPIAAPYSFMATGSQDCTTLQWWGGKARVSSQRRVLLAGALHAQKRT